MPIPETTSQWNYWLMSVQLENREARDEFSKQNQWSRCNDKTNLAVNVQASNVFRLSAR